LCIDYFLKHYSPSACFRDTAQRAPIFEEYRGFFYALYVGFQHYMFNTLAINLFIQVELAASLLSNT
jgi:hypothetical protein